MKHLIWNITFVRKEHPEDEAAQEGFRRGFECSHAMKIPYPVLCGSQCTHQGSTREVELQGCACPTEARDLCYRTKHTPSPGFREAEREGGTVASPDIASGPQVSQLINNHMCELQDGCCFPSASKSPENLPVAHPNWKHKGKRIWRLVVQLSQVDTLLQSHHAQKC